MDQWGEDKSLFYRRLEEIRQLAEQDPQRAQQEMEALMRDYPGMIEDLQSDRSAGERVMEQGFGVAGPINGPAQNPFAYQVADVGGNIAKGVQIGYGGKMAREAKEGIADVRDTQMEERIKLGQTAMPGDTESEEEKRKKQQIWSYILRNSA